MNDNVIHTILIAV